MKHAIIVAHPNLRSLACAVAETYAKSVEKLGHEAVLRDLYRLDFDPCLKAEEIPGPAGYQFGADVVAERRLIADADVFVLVYPFWFNAPPAILKGYIDRVFSMGFGYEPGLGGTEPLLDGRKLISFSSSGAPDDWVRDTGAMSALIALFDRHLSAVCGLNMIDHVHSGGIVSDITEEAVQEILDRVRRAVDVHFGGLARRDGSPLRTAT